MNRKIIFITLLLAVIATSLAFFGCNLASLAGRSNYSRFASLDSYDDGTVSIPSGKFFYIRISRASGGFGRFIQHALYAEKEGPGTDCKIPVDEESTEDMFCMLEKMEGDLWAHDTTIEYNVPAGMCKYLAFQTHWHWNQNAGGGPERVYKCKRSSSGGGSGEDDDSSERYSTSCIKCGDCKINRGKISEADCSPSQESIKSNWSDSDCKNTDEIPCSKCTGDYPEEVEDLCPYDLSQENENLANCCTDSYNGYGGAEDGEWGDSLEQCIGGLGRVNWDTKDKNGIPKGKVVNSEANGYIGTYKIPNIDSWYDGPARVNNQYGIPAKVSGPSFVTANYYEDIEDDTSNKPEFYNSNYSVGYPYISWACLDSAHEVMHRILLVVREWNSQEEFLKFKESEGSRGNPDINGSEGSDCDYYSQSETGKLQFGECNDASDADDWRKFINNKAGRYPHVIYK